MKTFAKKTSSKGFTIIELLTVISVIAILMGLIVPSLQKVKEIAKDIQQKAMFHSISVALDIFQNEMEEYPDSTFPTSSDMTGAHALGEALAGRDLQGFDPMSTWYATSDYTNGTPYSDDTSGSPSGKELSLARREGPYLNLERGGAYDLEYVYQGIEDKAALTGAGLYADYKAPAPVLTDIYRHNKVTITNTTTSISTTVKIGAPILYFKANQASKDFVSGSNGSFNSPAYDTYIYNYNDNYKYFNLKRMADSSATAPFSPRYTNNAANFYDDITNSQVTTIERPYNAKTYILLSAGADSIYGTSDDIWNFGE